jgi:hypothetical protein
MMREEDYEETEAPARIRMRAHTAWLLAGATGPEPPGWTSPEERAHYEHLWHRVPTSRRCDGGWDEGVERGVMFVGAARTMMRMPHTTACRRRRRASNDESHTSPYAS